MGRLRGEEGEQGVSLRLLLAHQMTTNTWEGMQGKRKRLLLPSEPGYRRVPHASPHVLVHDSAEIRRGKDSAARLIP